MVNLPTPARVVLKNANSPVERASHKLSSCWGIVNIGNSPNVIFVNCSGFVHLAHIERITVAVVISYSEVYRLNRVKAHTHCLIWQCNLLNRRLSSEIVKDYRPINAWAAKNVRLCSVIFHFKDTVNVPLQLINRLCSLVRPDLNDLSWCCELIIFGRVLNISDYVLAQVLCNRLCYFLLFVESELSEYTFFVVCAVEHAFEIVKIDCFVSRRWQKPVPVWRKGNSFDCLCMVICWNQAPPLS